MQVPLDLFFSISYLYNISLITALRQCALDQKGHAYSMHSVANPEEAPGHMPPPNSDNILDIIL